MKIDLLFRNAEIYNVFVRRWFRQDVAVIGERVLFVGDTAAYDLKPERVVECGGRPLIPGLIDIHLHIESSLCTPEVFGSAVLQCGVTTVVSEPHEIANVFGPEGIEEMIRVSTGSPVDIFYGVPSSVPSTSANLETTGGSIRPEDAVSLFRKYPEVICLGEVMDFSSLARMETGRITEIISAVQRNSPLAAIEGHCPSIRNMDLAKVLYAGVDSDHCLQDPIGMKQRFENGMFVEIQEKSLTADIVRILKESNSEGLYGFVTDDVPPDILINDGHLDYVVRKALRLGLPLGHAVTASSWAPAGRMGFRDRGAVSPGKLADLLLLEDDSPDFNIRSIFRKGCEVGKAGMRGFSGTSPIRFKDRFKTSIRLDEEDIHEGLFQLIPPGNVSSVRVLTLEKNQVNTYTKESFIELPVRDNAVLWEGAEADLVIVMDRYSGRAGFARGFMSGSYFRNGAAATTYAHDHHNLMGAGDNRRDMEIAMKWVIRNQGGICVVSNGRILASMVLTVGGILSEKTMEDLSEEVEAIVESMRQLGFMHRNPLMSFSTLTLPVSPDIKITDKGIFRTGDGTVQNLFLSGKDFD